MKLLTRSEAYFVLLTAAEQVDSTPTYRPGQAIYNLICDKFLSHEEIISVIDHYKWYNSKDVEYCVDYFLDHFVGDEQ